MPIRALLTRLYDEVKPTLEIAAPADEARLKTELCGVPLENPFLLSSSVVASTYDMCARAFEAGWAGAAFKTICTLDIHEASPRFSAITGDNGSIIGFKNIEQLSDHSLAENMKIFRELKKNYPTKFILASLMGQNEQEWEELSRLCEENGADAVELNFSCPNMAEGGLGSDIGQVPELVERFTAAAKRGCKIPVLASAVRSTSMEPVQWDVDSLDWKGIFAAEITKRVTSKVGCGSIVLFHNAGEHTPEALPEILRCLKQQGYETVPVSQLLLSGEYTLDHEGRQCPAG